MSSILKALKKLENETAETHIPTWPHHIDNRSAIAHRNKRSKRRDRIIILLLAFCALALIGKTLVGSNFFKDEKAPAMIATKKEPIPPNAAKAPAPIVRIKKKVPPPKNTSREIAEESEIPSPVVPLKKSPPAPLQETPEERPLLSANDQPPPQKPTPKKSEVALPTATFQNTGLRLQALVWSEKPEDRFAVINNRILHENDRIEKATMIKIHTDFVVIELEGTRWRLKHNLH